MKTYKAELVEFLDENGNPYFSEAMDLVNVEDNEDRLYADPDSFTVGELVTEDQIYIKPCSYVDEDNYGTCDFAFKIEK